MMRSWLVVVSTCLVVVSSACGQAPSGDDDAALATGPLRFVGNDQLQFSEAPSQAAAGELTVELVAEGAVNHNVTFEGVNNDEPVVEAVGGETATGTVTLQPGEYTYFCGVPGHREAGMEGTLTVGE